MSTSRKAPAKKHPRRSRRRRTRPPRAAAAVTVERALHAERLILALPGPEHGQVARHLTLMISGTEVHADCGEHDPPRASARAAGTRRLLRAVPGHPRGRADHRDQGRTRTPLRASFPAARSWRARGRGPRRRRPPPGPQTGRQRARDPRRRRPGRPRGRPHRARRRRPGRRSEHGHRRGQAVGQTAGAAGAAVSSTAGAVGKVADLGREGMRTGRAAIEAADNAGARRFARDNRKTEGEGSDGNGA